MSLAKFILSQNVRRVRVCKRHSHPRPEPQSPERRQVILMVGVGAFHYALPRLLDLILILSLRCFALNFIPDFPDHAAKLTGDGYFDFVVMHESFAQTAGTQVEAVLCFPRDLADPTR
jgi:hypothetical protein